MKMLLGLLLLGIITVSGCTSVPGSDGTGNFILKISDQSTEISSFDSLIVSFIDARVFKIGEENGTAFQIFDLNGTSVDLTQLVGEKTITILNSVLPSGTYSKVELNVKSVEGIVSGETVEVEVPSEKLKVIRPFVISDGESTEFIFDIDVIRKGEDGYNLLPVIGKSGVVGKDIPREDVEDVECSVDGDCDEEFACIENVCVGAVSGTDGLTGNLVLLVSDAKADIEDFDSLIVSFSKTRIFGANESGFQVFSLNGTSVDITQLVGEKAISVLEIEIAVGTYSKIEMYVSDVDGIVNGTSVDVKIPSEKLQIIKSFIISDNTTTKFVFDINVVKKGEGGYNLLPVIGESGTTEEITTEEVECTIDSDCNSTLICVANMCVMNETNETVECTIDSDCNSTSICVDNVCVMNETNETVECTIDSNCNSTFICVNNVCVENPSPEQCDFENVTSVHDCGNETFMLNFTFPDIGFNITFGNETIVCTNLENITSECQDYLNVCSEANLCQ